MIGGCAFTVFTAISFHFVTSFAACATVGTASATTVMPITTRIRRMVSPLGSMSEGRATRGAAHRVIHHTLKSIRAA